MTVAIGMYRPKDTRNIGSLLRSAHLYDVDLTFQVGGAAYDRPHATDTSNSTKHIPHYQFLDLQQFLDELEVGVLMGTTPVAVEMDALSVPLSNFGHPASVAYLLGSENHGIPRDVLGNFGQIVQVETPNPWSLNVATTGAIVLHHRYTQLIGAAA